MNRNTAISSSEHLVIERLIRIARNGRAASVLLEAAGCSQDHVDYMASPIIVCQLPDTTEQFPFKLVEVILLGRLDTILSEIREADLHRRTGKLATLAEVGGYMYPAAVLGHLPGEEWNSLWLWLVSQLSTYKYQLTDQDGLWEKFINSSTVEMKLSDREYRLYKGLSECIRSLTRGGRLGWENPYLDLDKEFCLPIIQPVSFEACFREGLAPAT